MLISKTETESTPVSNVQWGLSALLGIGVIVTTYLTSFAVGLAEVDTAQIQALVNAGDTSGVEELLDMNIGDISRVAFPIGQGIIVAAVAHEISHRLAAKKNNVKLSPPYFLPNMSIGTLGAVTQLKSLAPNKSALFDIAASGPVAGGSAALTFFLFGLFMSATTAAGDPSLIPLSTSLLESSFLLGGLVRGVLGQGTIFCHPYLVAGWCGLIATALNLLPIGSTDGGRIMNCRYGRRTQQLASFFTYLGMGLGFLAPGFGLSWGLTTIFLQREQEKNIKDQYTKMDGQRSTVATILLILAILVLFPSGEAFTSTGLPMID